MPRPASAQQSADEPEDVFTLYASSNTLYDSNLFHLASTVDPTEDVVGDDKRWDLVQTATVGFHLDKQYWQQEFLGDASFARNWHQNYDFLDASATNFSLAWKWHLTPWIQGKISGDRREVPADYDFYRSIGERNYHKQQDYGLRLDANPFGGWHLIGGGGAFLSSNTGNGNDSDTPKSQQYYFDGGFGYQTLANSKLQLIGRHAEGSYARSNSAVFSDARDFAENSGEFQFVSNPLLPVSLKVEFGYLARSHDDFSARNYKGWTADTSVNWQATDKILLTGRALRTLNPYQDPYFTDYSREEYTFTPTWTATAKIVVSGSAGISRYRFGGFSSSGTDQSRTDWVGVYEIDASWVPTRFLTVKADASNRVRDSSFRVQNLDYTGSIFQLSVILSY